MSFSVEHPVAYYATLAAAMGACLYLFVSLGGDIAKTRRRLVRAMEAFEEEAGVAAGRLDTVERRLASWEERVLGVEQTVAALGAVRRTQLLHNGVDANQRAQVLRLARRGVRPEEIAAELHVPQNEVELLVKVERALARAG